MPKQLYKILGPDRQPCLGGTGQWPQPGTWRTVEGKLVPCENGLHLCRPKDLLDWLTVGREVWHVSKRGETLVDDNKLVVRESRLTGTGPVCVWTERLNRLLACDYAEHVLSLYEDARPDDNRPRHVIEVSRRYARGEATMDELTAAGAAARDATHAARDASNAACDAAWSAAYATYATCAAARAASDAERDWQTERLLDYIEGRVS